jgi:hypothetical protein
VFVRITSGDGRLHSKYHAVAKGSRVNAVSASDAAVRRAASPRTPSTRNSVALDVCTNGPGVFEFVAG